MSLQFAFPTKQSLLKEGGSSNSLVISIPRGYIYDHIDYTGKEHPVCAERGPIDRDCLIISVILHQAH